MAGVGGRRAKEVYVVRCPCSKQGMTHTVFWIKQIATTGSHACNVWEEGGCRVTLLVLHT